MSNAKTKVANAEAETLRVLKRGFEAEVGLQEQQVKALKWQVKTEKRLLFALIIFIGAIVLNILLKIFQTETAYRVIIGEIDAAKSSGKYTGPSGFEIAFSYENPFFTPLWFGGDSAKVAFPAAVIYAYTTTQIADKMTPEKLQEMYSWTWNRGTIPTGTKDIICSAFTAKEEQYCEQPCRPVGTGGVAGAVTSIGTQMASFGAMGFMVGGPVGGGIGAAVGAGLSIFNQAEKESQCKKSEKNCIPTQGMPKCSY